MTEVEQRRRVLRILCLDGGPGLLVGVGLWLLRGLLAPLYAMPGSTYDWVASANVAYGCGASALAFAVARGGRPPAATVTTLAGANALWAVVCALLLATRGAEFGLFGGLHVAGEGLYVAALAALEWRVVRPWAVESAREAGR